MARTVKILGAQIHKTTTTCAPREVISQRLRNVQFARDFRIIEQEGLDLRRKRLRHHDRRRNFGCGMELPYFGLAKDFPEPEISSVIGGKPNVQELTLRWLRFVCPQQLTDLRDRGQPVDTNIPLQLHTLQVAQHFSDGWLTLLPQFAEKRGGIALPLVQPLRAINKTYRLAIAVQRRPVPLHPAGNWLAWNRRVVATWPQRIEATDPVQLSLVCRLAEACFRILPATTGGRIPLERHDLQQKHHEAERGVFQRQRSVE